MMHSEIKALFVVSNEVYGKAKSAVHNFASSVTEFGGKTYIVAEQDPWTSGNPIDELTTKLGVTPQLSYELI